MKRNYSFARYVLYAAEAVVALVLVFLYVGVPWGTVSMPALPVAPGTLLFVEDLDGRGGMMDGDFGDLVTLNPKTGDRNVLTRDDHYDTHPSWGPEGRYILFESKRGQNRYTRDMGALSHIYRLDLADGEIRRWRPDLADRFPVVGEETSRPAVSSTGTRVAFATPHSSGSPWDRIVVYDRERDSLRVVADSVTITRRLMWSEDERYLGFSAAPRGMAIQHSALLLVDVHTGKRFSHGEEKNRQYTIDDIYNDRIIYKTGPINNKKYKILESSYPVLSDQKQVYQYIGGQEVFRHSVYASPDSIYVLARESKEDGASSEVDVCVQALDTGTRRCFTGEQKHRSGLRILRQVPSANE